MADVTLTLGDRRHIVTCRNGEESAVRRLGDRLDQHWAAANRAAGGTGGERAMLFVALMLADELENGGGGGGGQPVASTGASEATLARLAEQLEHLADALEQTPAGA